MAPGRTLNAANLERLGAPALAELLMEISRGSAAAQRRLRLALAGDAGADQVARAVAKRLTSIAGARTWLNWQKIKPLVVELEAQRRAILDLVAPSDPREAFELMWRLAACAGPVLARSDDTGDRLLAAFGTAVQDLGPLARRAGLPAEDLAGRVFRALAADERGSWNELVPVLAPQLGAAGLGMVRSAVRDWMQDRGAEPLGADGMRFDRRRRTAFRVLEQVADALGDVDGFIELFDGSARRTPIVAANIARRLLAAKRPAEAWTAVERVEPERREQAPPEWDRARIDVLEALGRSGEAQDFRWARFLATLDAALLRAHLATLPDFDDLEVEQHAMAHASAFADVHRALAFLLAWPDLHRASELVLGRTRALNGDLYEVLSPAADALDARYPLAATLLRRTMIDFALRAGRSSRYRHAARHLRDCRAAADRVPDFGGAPDHPSYERALRTAHGRKAGFWQELAESR
ncbi:MAG: hypothetical protein INR65_11750 [Gluconacetobacter diazotrophicus]|nr:hypothetical protein [Gluconacetobacter diazotrophicus]